MWKKLKNIDCCIVSSGGLRWLQRLQILFKAAFLLTILYVFTCSLDLLSRGFRLINGKSTGYFFHLTNTKLAGVMIGILTTVLLHSSSASTSIVVAMVISGAIKVPEAIPIIMGANIGTSITTTVSTLISFPKAGQVEQFRLAFSCATLHSMFNWCSVVAVIIIEFFFEKFWEGYLQLTSKKLTNSLTNQCNDSSTEIHFLYNITKPVVNLIVQIDDKALTCYSNLTRRDNCTSEYPSLIKCNRNYTDDYDYDMKKNCENMSAIFQETKIQDEWIGILISVFAIASVVSCLLLNVKILKSMLQLEGTSTTNTRAKILNADIPYVPWLTEYLAIILGTIATMLIQSSSVFTSSIATLVGLEFLTLKRAYSFTLGANIGTTASALITALAAANISKECDGVQIALCHVIFNLTGVLIFYPIPFLRLPITMAMYLGQRTAMYRWFAVVFMALMFMIGPLLFMFLSMVLEGYLACFTAGMIIAVILFFICVNKMREQCPGLLPDIYVSWKWLPLWIRSLEPYDRVITGFCSKASQLAHSSSRTLPYANQPRSNNSDNNNVEVEMEQVNPAFQHEE